MSLEAAESAREYYRALDEHDYDAFEGLLAPEFVHDRPDRTFEGREGFVEFMRDGRPKRDTRHRVDAVYRLDDEAKTRAVAVQGCLLDGDGSALFEFVDVFGLGDAGIERVDTYTRSS